MVIVIRNADDKLVKRIKEKTKCKAASKAIMKAVALFDNPPKVMPEVEKYKKLAEAIRLKKNIEEMIDNLIK